MSSPACAAFKIYAPRRQVTYRCGSASGKILRKTAVLLPGPQPNNTARGENLRSAGEICKFHQAHTNCGAPHMTPTAQKRPGIRCSGGFPALSCVSKCAKPKRIANCISAAAPSCAIAACGIGCIPRFSAGSARQTQDLFYIFFHTRTIPTTAPMRTTGASRTNSHSNAWKATPTTAVSGSL